MRTKHRVASETLTDFCFISLPPYDRINECSVVPRHAGPVVPFVPVWWLPGHHPELREAREPAGAEATVEYIVAVADDCDSRLNIFSVHRDMVSLVPYPGWALRLRA
jgi:hypothetical protein